MIEHSEFWRHDFEYEREEVLHRLEAQNQLGQAALKSMMLVNGGAIIALLTFVGNKGTVANACAVKWGMGLFGAGLFFALFAYFGAYFSQADAMLTAAYRVRNAQSQMAGGEGVEPPPIHERRANVLLFSAVGCVLLSLLLFGAGAIATMNGIL